MPVRRILPTGKDQGQVCPKVSSKSTVEDIASQPDSTNQEQGNQRSNLGGLTRFLLIVAFAKVFFEPDVEANEEVTATHFVDLEFGGAGATIAPSNWNHSPGIAAHDCF